MTFIIGTFQSQCKSDHNQVKWNKITRDICESDSIFPYLQGSTLIRGPKVPFCVFDILKKEIQNSILTFCFHFNTKNKIQITDHHFHV